MAQLPLIIEPEDFASLDTRHCLILDLSSEANHLAGHIPGAIYLPFKLLMCGQPPAPGKIPSEQHIQQLFSQLGITPDTHIIAYDDEGGGWAGRLIWTLDVIGHSHYSYINGGLTAWKQAKLPLETRLNNPTASAPMAIQFNPEYILSTEDVTAFIGQPNYTIWDARTAAEYSGEKVLAAKGGHIPGAIHCEWTELMDHNNGLKIRLDALDYLKAKGITSDSPIVTHCQSHHRSAFTYLVGKSLGFNIHGYHGSWSEWGNLPDTPVER